MIYIKNSQRKFNVNIENIRKSIELILGLSKYKDFDISLWLTNNKTIQKFNLDYRGKDKATDVLSFPYHEVQAGKRIKVKLEEDKNLGDIIISVEYVNDQAKKLKTTLDKRIIRLIVHGTCHLLGYDHIEDADWRKMRAKEGWLLKKLKEQKLF